MRTGVLGITNLTQMPLVRYGDDPGKTVIIKYPGLIFNYTIDISPGSSICA